MKNAAIGNNFGNTMGQILPINWATYTEAQAQQAIQYFTGTQPGGYNLERTTYRIYVPIGDGSGIDTPFYLVAKDDLSKSIKAEKRLDKDDLVFVDCLKVGFVNIVDGMHKDNMPIRFFPSPVDFPAAEAPKMIGAWDCAQLSAEVNGNAGLLYKYSLKDSMHVPEVMPTAAGELVPTGCGCTCETNPILALCGNQSIKFNHKWSDAYEKPANADGEIYAVLELSGLTAKGCAEKFCSGVDSHNVNRCPAATAVAVVRSKAA